VFLGPGKQYPLSPRGPDRVSRAGQAPARGGVATTISNETAQLLRVRSADGTAIAAYRSGTGSPLVLVHGVSSDRTRSQPVLPALERAHTIYAMDRRGRGGSGDGSTYTIEREFEDVAALVNAIPHPVALLGHSFGAAVALRAALLTSTVQTLLLYEGGGKPKGVISFAPAFIERIEALLAAGERDRLVATFLRDAVADCACRGARRTAPQCNGHGAAPLRRNRAQIRGGGGGAPTTKAPYRNRGALAMLPTWIETLSGSCSPEGVKRAEVITARLVQDEHGWLRLAS